MPVPAAIPEYGVIMFIDRKLMLYKHKLCTGPPLVTPAKKAGAAAETKGDAE